jgi:hypothetical protein
MAYPPIPVETFTLARFFWSRRDSTAFHSGAAPARPDPLRDLDLLERLGCRVAVTDEVTF